MCLKNTTKYEIKLFIALMDDFQLNIHPVFAIHYLMGDLL